MPFDERDFPASRGPDPDSAAQRQRRWVAGWLGVVAFMILVMIVLGGATRLTGSGLSIMEWAPLSGALPPLSEAEWQRLFTLYQHIPQYTLLHEGFGLDGFKQIFWLEWVHRLWGRMMGVAFLVPAVVFAVRGMIPRRLAPRLVALFALGGLQGVVGWFMVASGFFPDSTAVSPYRLVIHLALALCLYAALVWTALAVWPSARLPRRDAVLSRLAAFVVIAVATTIVAGGFVAGLHAGLTYNTFPLMDGRLVPSGYAALAPFARNLTENVAAVQFDHRLLATVTAGLVLATIAVGLWRGVAGRTRTALVLLGLAVVAQYALGVATLLWVVPVPLAVAHQTGAALLLTAALFLRHAARGGAGV